MRSFLLSSLLIIVALPLSAQTVADFEVEATGTQGFADNGWGTGFVAVERQDDPTGRTDGVLALQCDQTRGEKGVVEKAEIDPMGAETISVDVYLPADFPDDAQVSLWGQDNVNWSGWNASEYLGDDMPKEEWHTLQFKMMELHNADPGTFNPYGDNILGKFGIQVYYGAGGSWNGTVFVDNVKLDVPRENLTWVVDNFEIEELGTAGFGKSYGDAFIDLYWFPDMTERSAGVLEFDVDFALDLKAAIQKDPVDVFWTDGDTGAIAFSFDLWLPGDFPESAVIKVFGQDRVNWTWTDFKYSVSGAGGDQIPVEEWTTVTFDLLEAMAGNPDIDLSSGFKVGMELYYDGGDWDGVVLVDNFTLIGVTQPASELTVPSNITANAMSDTTPYGETIYYNEITWQELPENASETYNVYASTSPITDVEADGVTRIATEVPRGTGYFNHQLYSKTEREKTYYYAVTTKGVENGQLVETGIEEGTNNTSAVTNNTTTAALIPLDPDFSLTIDGSLDEFAAYEFAQLVPDRMGGPAAEAWTTESDDLNFTGYLVMDNKNLYVGFNVVDDFPNYGEQAWEGDGFDIFTGLYDAMQLDAYHGDGAIYSTDHADYRLSFAVNAAPGAQFQKSGSEAWDLTGMELGIEKSDNGYVVEAKIPFQPLKPLYGDVFEPAVGMYLPLKIDVNDNDGTDDPYYAGSNRTMTAHWGGVDNALNWRRPYTWGMALITGPTAVEDNTPTVPKTTELHPNYPNPFNPTTTIRYNLGRDSHVSVVVHDLLGRQVRTLTNENLKAGQHSVVWNSRDDNGRLVGAGVYFVTLQTDDYKSTQKILLVK